MKSQSGQTLLEIILAFSVSVIILSAVVLSVIASLNNAQYTKNQSLANAYAQEGITILKNIRDSDLNSFLSLTNGKYCLGSNASILIESDRLPVNQNCVVMSGKALGDPAIFGREIEIAHNSNKCCSSGVCPTPSSDWGSQIRVTVYWADAKCGSERPICHNVELISCFSKIDLLSSP